MKGFAKAGVNAHLVEVETKTIYEQPLISIVGLGDMAVKEPKERSCTLGTGSKLQNIGKATGLVPVALQPTLSNNASCFAIWNLSPVCSVHLRLWVVF